MTEHFDVVIVGARCAGASLGARLAQAGGKILLLDADALPSDMSMSTHYVQPPGMDVLDELGVGVRVRATTPASHVVRVQMDDAGFTARIDARRSGYCVRRLKLDAWLQDVACDAGAELRDRSKVTELIDEGDRVRGVCVQGPGGSYRVTADLVVGADGQHSTVAKHTQVESYLDFESTRGGYWFYWPKPRAWGTSAYPYHALIAHVGRDMLYVFQCDDDLLLIAVVTPHAKARSWGASYRERYLAWLRDHPIAAPLVEDNAPIGKGMGLLKPRFFYKRPVGPGFALVGDAGHFKDFVTGHGISDALLGARDLASAILDGRPEASKWYWRQRDAATLPLYMDAKRQGEVGMNNAMNRLVFRKLGEAPELATRVLEVADRRRLPHEMLEAHRVLGWVGSAVVRGQLDVLPGFRATGQYNQAVIAELAHRRALLAQAESALGGAPRTHVFTASQALAAQ